MTDADRDRETLMLFAARMATHLSLSMLILALATAYDGRRDASLWLSCLGVITLTIGASCWIQDRLWKADASREPKGDADPLTPPPREET
jgi:hypothetical protein